MQVKEVIDNPILHIKNVREEFLRDDYFQKFMSSRKYSNGGEIKSWRATSDPATKVNSVKVIYKDPAGICYNI